MTTPISSTAKLAHPILGFLLILLLSVRSKASSAAEEYTRTLDNQRQYLL